MKTLKNSLLMLGAFAAIAGTIAGCGAAKDAVDTAKETATTAAGDAAAKAGDAAKGMASEGIAKFEATIKDGLAKIPNLDMTKIKFTTEGNTLKVTGDVGSADIRAKIDETLMKANNPLFKIDTTGLLPAAKPAESAPADKPAAK